MDTNDRIVVIEDEHRSLIEEIDTDIAEIDVKISYLQSLISTLETYINDYKNQLLSSTDPKFKNACINRITYLNSELAKILEVLQKYLSLREQYRKDKLSALYQKHRLILKAETDRILQNSDFTKIFKIAESLEQEENSEEFIDEELCKLS